MRRTRAFGGQRAKGGGAGALLPPGGWSPLLLGVPGRAGQMLCMSASPLPPQSSLHLQKPAHATLPPPAGPSRWKRCPTVPAARCPPWR